MPRQLQPPCQIGLKLQTKEKALCFEDLFNSFKVIVFLTRAYHIKLSITIKIDFLLVCLRSLFILKSDGLVF